MKQGILYCVAIAAALLLPAGRIFADDAFPKGWNEAFLKVTEAHTRELQTRLRKSP